MPPPSQESLLATLQAELDTLSARLVEKEIQLAALQQDLRRFEAEYQTCVGPYYLRLDELNAALCERRAAENPLDESLQTAAESARQQAEATRAGVEAAELEGVPPRVELPEAVRKLFRKAAMRLHPDRAVDEADRQRREHWMARLNAAYTQGDGAAIESIIKDFEESPEAVAGEDLDARMERTRRQTVTVQRHIARIERERAELEASESNQLRLAFERQAAQGFDPYAVLIADIGARIAEVEAELKPLHAPPVADPPKRPFRPEGLKHRTDRGEKVRSKSEVIVANALHGLGVGYLYEHGLTAADGSTLLPDFTIFDSEQQPILWEHLVGASGNASSRGLRGALGGEVGLLPSERLHRRREPVHHPRRGRRQLGFIENQPDCAVYPGVDGKGLSPSLPRSKPESQFVTQANGPSYRTSVNEVGMVCPACFIW